MEENNKVYSERLNHRLYRLPASHIILRLYHFSCGVGTDNSNPLVNSQRREYQYLHCN